MSLSTILRQVSFRVPQQVSVSERGERADGRNDVRAYDGTLVRTHRKVTDSRPKSVFSVCVPERQTFVPLWTGTATSSPTTALRGPRPKAFDPDGGVLSSVSCPTASFCAAADSSGNAFIYDGSSWSSPDSIDPGNTIRFRLLPRQG